LQNENTSNDPSASLEHDEWFTENLLPHEQHLRIWLKNRFPTLFEVDDIIQDSYVKVISRKSNSDLKSPKSYLYAVARNKANDMLRRKKIVQYEPLAKDDVLHANEGSEIPERLSRKNELELLEQAVQSLPERCRQIFTMRKVHGMKHSEIAQIMKITENTVAVQIAIGIRKCREFLISNTGGEIR